VVSFISADIKLIFVDKQIVRCLLTFDFVVKTSLVAYAFHGALNFKD